MRLPNRFAAPLLVAGIVALAACGDHGGPVGPEQPTTPGALLSRSNTLQICHVTGKAGVRLMSVDPSSEADHLGHGDWHPFQAWVDADGDGWGSTAWMWTCEIVPGLVLNHDDCDDTDAASHPGAAEIVGDGKDNDCDGLVDESWASWGAAARGAARSAARSWLQTAHVSSDACNVYGPTATAGPGSVSGTSVAGRVKTALLDAGAPADIAQHWDDAFALAWRGWANGITIPALPWYPAFALWAGPQAPPTPNIPTPLASLVSVGAPGMGVNALASSVTTAIGPQGEAADAAAAIAAFGADIGARFAQTLGATVTNVYGEGPVPSFAPPFVLVGPVAGGDCFGGDFPASHW